MKVTIEDHSLDDESRARFLAFVKQAAEVFGEDVEIVYKRRTSLQNRSLHKWLGMMAEALNDAGMEQRKTWEKMPPNYEVPWSTLTVKENLYKPVLNAMTGKTSTTEMDTVEPGEVCKVLGARLAERFGITPPPWPSVESMSRE